MKPISLCVPVLNTGLLHAVLQVGGLVAEEHVTGAGGGVAGRRMELLLHVTRCNEETHTHTHIVR